MRSFTFCTVQLHYWGEGTEDDEMDGICSTHGADEMCMQNVSRRLEDEVNHSEYTGVKGRILLRMILKEKDIKMWFGFVWLEVVLKKYVVLGIS
jgi:hypothetical protein